MKAIGLMSGTSVDGVDAVLLELEPPEVRAVPRVLAHAYLPFEDALRRELAAPLELSLPRIAALHYELPELYAEVVRRLPGWNEADCVGMHGQTVWHAPASSGAARPHTLQLGNSGVLAARLGLPVVGDFRSADLAHGGEGAPIIPLCHWYFVPPERGPVLVVNLGGIANYTYVAPRLDDVVASDIGPGMMLTDAFARLVSDGREHFDRDGVLSRNGTPQRAMVDRILRHPFFERRAPRTTGREDFGADFFAVLAREFATVAPADQLCSCMQATAEAIAAALRELPHVQGIILPGGGAQHPGLRERIRSAVAPCPVEVPDDGVLAPQHHEAAGMALLAARTLHRLPSALPRVTGARRAAVLGHVYWPD